MIYYTYIPANRASTKASIFTNSFRGKRLSILLVVCPICLNFILCFIIIPLPTIDNFGICSELLMCGGGVCSIL